MLDRHELVARMEALARHDAAHKVFGARTHRWSSRRLTDEEVAAGLLRHGASAPEAWRWWVTEGPGVGAGPFYGLQAPDAAEPAEGELQGALPLSDQGCGYSDWLQTRGDRAGEVWVDMGSADGPVARWYPSLEAWLDAWLRRSYAEWGAAALAFRVPKEVEPTFLAAVADALIWATTTWDDPMVRQYPIPRDRALQALATLRLAASDWDGALAAFEAGADVSPEGDAARALGRCRVAGARGDWEALLAAADAGLAVPGVGWATRGELLQHRAGALEGLERWDDAVASREDLAAHYERDAHFNVDVVWIRMLRGETELAAARARALAARGVGCDEGAGEVERLRQVVGDVLARLRAEDMGEDADALAAALGLT